MTRRKNTTIAILVLLGFAAGPAIAGVAEIVAQMPAKDPATGQPLLEALVKLGPAGVKELCGMINPPAKPDDAKARFALHGIVLHTKRPGAEADRAMVEGVLIGAMTAAKDTEVKAFFVRQLQLTGSDAAVAPLGKLLGDETLCEPTTQALLRIGTAGCVAQLRAALAGAEGGRRLTLVRALGDARDAASAKAILPHAAAEDRTLRHAAWFALANIGDASATAALAKAAESKGNYERAVGTKYYLLLARRLAEGGDKAACAKICRGLLASRTGPTDGNVRCAALTVLADATGPAAVDEVLAGVSDKSTYVRDTALKILGGMKAPGVTKKLIAAIDGASPQLQAAIIGALGRSGDASAADAVAAKLTDKEKPVRLAAIDAIGRVAPAKAAAALAKVAKAGEADEIAAAKTALLTLKAPGVSADVAAGLGGASPAGKVALLEVLAARGATDQSPAVFATLEDSDADVRKAAIRALLGVAGPDNAGQIVDRLLKAASSADRAEYRRVLVQFCRASEQGPKPVLAALPKATGPQRATLLDALAAIGGDQALTAVLADAKSSDEAVKDAAVRALTAWTDAAAAGQLLEIARSSDNDVHKVLALRGYVRLVGEPSDRPVAETVAMYEKALAVAAGASEKKLVLGGLGNVRSVEALALAGGCLADAALTEVAAAAAVKIACPASRRDKGLRGPVVAEVLEKVVEAAKNKRTVELAKQYLATLPKPKKRSAAYDLLNAPVLARGAEAPKGPAGQKKPDEPALPPLPKPDAEGFIPLFNGKDLTGWVGATKGYAVENGVMFCMPKGGGNLYTAHQFGDFILKFEFKLPEGANNGLGIRTPMGVNAAYQGMELQVLDDSAERYAKLRPEQYHGSIYDVVAAKRGHQKPVGQWNTQEVRAIGPKITVILNGATIVDADLDEVRKTIDPKKLAKHPGLNRAGGHIGWLGHGSKVEFRNIRIKPIAPYTGEPPKAMQPKPKKRAAEAAKGAAGQKDPPAPAKEALPPLSKPVPDVSNVPPKGFAALFNGKDLTNWKGLVGNPKTRAKMTPEKLAAEQKTANERMVQNWKVVDGTLVFSGKGKALCTAKDYGDFEMYVDWKIHKGGDSGIYLRGTPQVQIWDPAKWPEGSGGLYNNKKNSRKPLVCADNPIGQWNRFRIKMVGERVWVWLNGQLVVDNTVMENYWERDKPIYPTGQIELQNHGSTLWFRNVFIREIPREK